MPKVYRRPAARRDLVETFVHLGEAASLRTAERFLASVRATCEKLAGQPLIGAPLRSRNPRLAGLRRWRVDGFHDVLVFYLVRRDGISVVRVLHGARDWWNLLGLDR